MPYNTIAPLETISDVLIDYDSTEFPAYIGYGVPGSATSDAKWRIVKISYSGDNVTTVRHADGDADMISTWDDRATYTYV